MSISNANARTDEQPIVSEHARLRYRQRVDACEPNVDEALRDMFRRGISYSGRDVHGPARRHGDHILVYQEGERPVIKTVLFAPRVAK